MTAAYRCWEGKARVGDNRRAILDYSTNDVRPHRRIGRVATGAAVMLTGLGYLLVYLVTGGRWLFYGYDGTRVWIFIGVPVSFFAAAVVGALAYAFRDVNRAWNTIALCIAGASLIAWVVYVIRDLPNC